MYDQKIPPRPDYQEEPRPRRRKHRFMRVFRMYLMIVGALATVAALVLLAVSLLVEIEKMAPGL